ncbi:MAG: glycosyltransferase [Bacteroidales bacterium]|nr:glycosyltransferase [Bacteroidales bacterium]
MNVLPKFSVIIPVYDRPHEVKELLDSLSRQHNREFEVIIVEDGSSVKCDVVCKDYSGLIEITYCYKENGGPAQARNWGAAKAKGEWLLFFDSDCIIPDHYFEAVVGELEKCECQLFGGADRSHPSFTTLQKAIDYSMTSIITTGGIRGNRKSADKFYPRTFNMGIKKSVFDEIGGFSNMRFGEDVDFSYKVKEGGYDSRFFPEAWVYHKRRNTLKTFFKQVFNSGIARIHLTKRHPGTLKPVHMLPALFVLGCIFLIMMSTILSFWFLFPIILLCLIIFTDAAMDKRGFKTSLYAIVASFTQLSGYGTGFLTGWWNICVLGKKNYAAFVKNFYR